MAQAFRTSLEMMELAVEPEALDVMTQLTGGWPHVIQVVGYHTAERARGSQTVTADHVRAAAPTVAEVAGSDLLLSVWGTLAEHERTALGVAALSTSPEIVARDLRETLRLDAPTFRHLRSRLVDSGLLQPSRHGRLVFPMLFARLWVRRQYARELEEAGDAPPEGVTAAGDVELRHLPVTPDRQAHLRSNGASSLERQSTKARAPRCQHTGVRTGVRCVRPEGHRGQHRYR